VALVYGEIHPPLTSVDHGVHHVRLGLALAHRVVDSRRARATERRCIFTKWENQILQVDAIEDHEEGWFVKEMTEAVTGWRPPTDLTRRVMAFWMWSVTLVSALRLTIL
jgi:hypothetical protein